METTGSGLAAAVCAVMGEVGGIGKTGRNDHHRYEYLTSADLLGRVQGLMARHGLAMWPSAIAREMVDLGTNKRGEPVSEMHLTVTYTVRHTTGESCEVVVVAQHSGDKASFAAMTGAQKYAVRQLFAIPDREDPETNENHPPADEPRRKRETPAERDARQAEHDRGWDAERPRFMAAIGEAGMSYDDLCAWTQAQGWGRPSSWRPEKRAGLLAKVDETAAKVSAWLEQNR